MEADNELEEKHKLGKVRFSIRNCKTKTMSSDETSYIFIFTTCFYSCRVNIEKDICHTSSNADNVLIFFLLQNKNHIKRRCIWDICCKVKAIIGAVKIWNSSINDRFQCEMTSWRSVHVTLSPTPRDLISHRLLANQIAQNINYIFFVNQMFLNIIPRFIVVLQK